jgi:hypothetical protein
VRARHASGGWFFPSMLLTSAALLIQYTADLVFDVRVAHGTEFAGDVADLLYFFALFTMLVALHSMRSVHARMEAELTRLMGDDGGGVGELDADADSEPEAVLA